MARVMVIEDDDAIGALLQTSLRSHGHDTTWQRSGRGALGESDSVVMDLVLLDLGLPDLDGIEVCRRLRVSQPGAVIVMLTARDEEMDVVVGLEAGADDYLTKPIRLAELHARIRAHLRRGASPEAQPSHVLGGLTVDMVARRATLNGRPVELRNREFDLLARLAAEPGVAISRATLMADVWGQNWFGQTKTLDVHIAAVRRKLAETAAGGGAATAPEIITLRGHGFRFQLADT